MLLKSPGAAFAVAGVNSTRTGIRSAVSRLFTRQLCPPRIDSARTHSTFSSAPSRRLLTGSGFSMSNSSELPSDETLATPSLIESVSLAERVLAPKNAKGELDASQLNRVDAMLRTSNGARGLFITLLSNPSVLLADAEPLDRGLVGLCKRDDPDENAVVSDLIVKNVVMSSAMALFYRRKGEKEAEAGSALTSNRAKRLMRAVLVDNATVAEKGAEMKDAFTARDPDREEGYSPFVRKWGYDAEQCALCAGLLEAILGQQPNPA